MNTLLVKYLFIFTLGIVLVDVMTNVPTTIDDFFLPGSQPGESGNLENPDKCDNCHGGYDTLVEPAYLWRGSMMAQAARDPLFFATMTIANQDAPQSGDLCLRCHTPKGWLEGRSVPTDGSALTSADREGVTCDFCHKMIKPTPLDVNPYPDDPDYTTGTYEEDQEYLAFMDTIPGYSANGMYIADVDNAKRGPYTDAAATHQFYYSPFHKESALCGTCHDVSNPAFSAVTDTAGHILYYEPNAFGEPAPDANPRTMFPVERTYSEWLVSAYNSPNGIPSSAFGGNLANVATCQDCHMKDVTGKGCNKNNAPVRNDLPLHDMSGGNTFIPLLIEDVFPGEADTNALAAGILRARYMLQNAATMELSFDSTTQSADVKIINETGHKLPSGYPEGRRMWLHFRAYGASGEIFESGYYDYDSADLVMDPDIKVYEIKPGISQSLSPIVNIPAGPSFHFVLNDTIYKDNRIPPRGFTNANYELIQSPIVAYSYPDSQYWDNTVYDLTFQPIAFEASLYYQTTSKEYVTFLRDENVTDDWGDIMYNLWETHGKSTPELMQYKTWGEPIVDNDEDGWPSFVDCDDSDPTIYPDAEELLDCKDNNCDGIVDEIFNSDSLYAWTGCAGNADWDDTLNWNFRSVPPDHDLILIPGMIYGDSFPIIRSDVSLKAVKIEPLASLTLDSTVTLTLDSFPEVMTPALDISGDVFIFGTLHISEIAGTAIEISSSGELEICGSLHIEDTGGIGIANTGLLQIDSCGVVEITVSPGNHGMHNLPGATFIHEGIVILHND